MPTTTNKPYRVQVSHMPTRPKGQGEQNIDDKKSPRASIAGDTAIHRGVLHTTIIDGKPITLTAPSLKDHLEHARTIRREAKLAS